MVGGPDFVLLIHMTKYEPGVQLPDMLIARRLFPHKQLQTRQCHIDNSPDA